MNEEFDTVANTESKKRKIGFEIVLMTFMALFIIIFYIKVYTNLNPKGKVYDYTVTIMHGLPEFNYRSKVGVDSLDWVSTEKVIAYRDGHRLPIKADYITYICNKQNTLK